MGVTGTLAQPPVQVVEGWEEFPGMKVFWML